MRQLKMTQHGLDPSLRRHGIVIEQYQVTALGQTKPLIVCPRETEVIVVENHLYRGVCCELNSVDSCGCRSRCIVDDDYFVVWIG